ncbi:MAG: leucine-rich repeat protein [Bacteroidales bacterium]|jgi:hypothetical protein
MKKVLLVLVAIIIGINLNTQAEDFSAINNGKTIYYQIISSALPRTVLVVNSDYSYPSYSGVVSIPDSVLYSGNYYTVTSIGNYAFAGCTGLTSITIPNSVTSIGDNCFQNCTGLTSVMIGNSVTSIGDGAFYGTTWYNNKPNGVVYINNVLYKYKGTMPANTIINIQAGTVSISGGAFKSCSGLTSITIPNSVTSIGNGAFYNCSGLTSITIPNSFTSIGDGAFSNCYELTSITIPNSVTSIGDYAFLNCTRLNSIIIPNSITSIGCSAFSSCLGLSSISIPNSVTSIGNDAFSSTPWYNNKPNGVVYINNVLYKYKGTMPANTTINIQAGTVSISGGAFNDCSGLTSITIPNSVTSICDYAFYDCRGLTSITCSAQTPPSLGEFVFFNVNKSIPLYVPEASVALYKAAEQWRDFNNIQIGLNDITVANKVDILIYPNPAKDKAKISIDNLSSKADVMVYDMVGRVIQTHKINKGNNELYIDLSGYSKGVYSIRIMNDSINQTKKLIVQ